MDYFLRIHGKVATISAHLNAKKYLNLILAYHERSQRSVCGRMECSFNRNVVGYNRLEWVTNRNVGIH